MRNGRAEGVTDQVVKELDHKRFNSLVGASRSPAAAYISEELGWYANDGETIIGVLLLDTIDHDYAAVILARDEGGRFRAFDQECSIATREEALSWLQDTIAAHTEAGVLVVPQGGEPVGVDLFTPIVAHEKLHPYFVALSSDSVFFPARSIISGLMPHYADVGGNFVEQFQSTGFDARLWELYLYAYLIEEQLFIDRSMNAPDFIIKKYGKTVAIEAVIVGRKPENPPTYLKEPSRPPTPDEVLEATMQSMPIKFGSPLYSKLTKEYWNLSHVKGNPLVFAIADFHDDMSMLWSSTALMNYLYGVKHDWHYDEKNQLIITPSPIAMHKIDGKMIPSGFFNQPGAENISAILSSASGTISKFNRLGRQAGFSVPNIQMIRMGMCYDHDPNASVPRMFRYEVDETSEETWGEGLSMFHNPNAMHEVPRELFPSIAHHYLREGQIVSFMPEFQPYASYTLNMRMTD